MSEINEDGISKQIICDYCGHVHIIPFDTPTKLLISWRKEGSDNKNIPPCTVLDISRDEEGIGTEIWLEDLITEDEEQIIEIPFIISDEDTQRALYRIYGKKYKKISSDKSGEIWIIDDKEQMIHPSYMECVI